MLTLADVMRELRAAGVEERDYEGIELRLVLYPADAPAQNLPIDRLQASLMNGSLNLVVDRQP